MKTRIRIKLALLAGATAMASVIASVLPASLEDVAAQEVLCENSPIIQWTEASGGNGHSYQLLCSPGITWQDARADAENRGGHLATLTSADEDSFVYINVVSPYYHGDTAVGPYLGGYQPVPPGEPEANPAAGWAWVTGEAWSYTSWFSGEPNDGGFGNTTFAEDFLHYYYEGDWNDVYNEWGVYTYVVEYEPRRQREQERPSQPNIGAGLSGLFNGQPTPLPTAPAPAAVAPATSQVISPPRTGDAGLK